MIGSSFYNGPEYMKISGLEVVEWLRESGVRSVEVGFIIGAAPVLMGYCFFRTKNL